MSMKVNATLAAIVITLAALFVLFYNPKEVTNKREDTSTASNEPQTYDSKLAKLSAENLETLSEPLTELKTETILSTEKTDAKTVATGDRVRVFYRGWLAKDGMIFDESDYTSTGFIFQVGQGVIQGWSLGTVGMKEGEVRRLRIPSELGYGGQDNGDIPANSDLIFDVEVLEVL